MIAADKLEISICIPTYNGEGTLRKTLDSMIAQIDSMSQDKFEIVICDDFSQDKTLSIAKEYAQRFSFIKVFANDKNLGMDGNFRKTALHGNGRFVWYCGQDDTFGPGAIAKVLTVIAQTDNLGFIYLNYSQLDHDMKRVLVGSFLHEETLNKSSFQEGVDIICRTPEEYFARFSQPPMFLPAILIRRDFWLETEVSAYEGTTFAQTAVIQLNLSRAVMYIVTKPYILGRIPVDQWQTHGPSFFRVWLGWITMETLVFRDPRNPIPVKLYRDKRRRFLSNFFPLVRRSRHLGMIPTKFFMDRLALVYGRGSIYWLYLFPTMHGPLVVLDAISAAYQVVKKIKRLFRV